MATEMTRKCRRDATDTAQSWQAKVARNLVVLQHGMGCRILCDRTVASLVAQSSVHQTSQSRIASDLISPEPNRKSSCRRNGFSARKPQLLATSHRLLKSHLTQCGTMRAGINTFRNLGDFLMLCIRIEFEFIDQ